MGVSRWAMCTCDCSYGNPTSTVASALWLSAPCWRVTETVSVGRVPARFACAELIIRAVSGIETTAGGVAAFRVADPADLAVAAETVKTDVARLPVGVALAATCGPLAGAA